jgi:hypothetical protein
MLMTREDLAAQVPAVLGSISFDPDMRSCMFRVKWLEDFQTFQVEVILVLDYEIWTDDTADACARASNLVWEVLAPLGVVVDPVCRSSAEHEEIADDADWVRLVGCA